MHDKLSASGAALLDSTQAADKGGDPPRAETLKPLKKASEEAEESERKASAGPSPPRRPTANRHDPLSHTNDPSNAAFSDSTGGKKTSRPASQSQRSDPDQRPRVSIETPACEKSLEENKDSMVVEVLQMYSAQQEKLQFTLRKQQQLEKVRTSHVGHVSNLT